jgi:hypothetical protein
VTAISPLLGRLGAGPRRRSTIIGTLAIVTGGSVLTVLPLPFWCLLVASETTLWSRHRLIAVLMAVLAVALLGTWAAYELRTASPLVDIGLLRHRAVAGANLAMLIGGIGETSSAMSFNQVVRSVGFSLGSAVGGLVLSARPSPRSLGGDAIFPVNSSYTTAAWIGAGIMAMSAVAVALATRE